MNAHTKVIVRQDYTKTDGSNPIYLRLTINRKLKYFSLNVSVKPGFWDDKTTQVKKSYPNSYNINLIISNAINRAKQIIFDFNLQNKSLTFGEFERLYSKPIIKGNSFYDFSYQELKVLKPKFSFYTIKTIEGHLTKLKGFAPELSFADITLSFIKEYDNYMIKLGNKENTRFKAMAVIKSLLNKAIKEGHIKENPFKLYPIGNKPGNRDFLSIDELKILETLLDKNLTRGLKNVLRYFLFSCYTGLRYQDIKNLKYSDLANDMIKIEMHKTKDIVTVPLTSKAKALIESGFPAQKIFRVNTNQVTNRHLKDITKIAEIHKKISFHCARHTFATIGITLGIPIEVISKLLGHKDLQTTQIYAKIMDDVKIKQMEKWDNM